MDSAEGSVEDLTNAADVFHGTFYGRSTKEYTELFDFLYEEIPDEECPCCHLTKGRTLLEAVQELIRRRETLAAYKAKPQGSMEIAEGDVVYFDTEKRMWCPWNK